MKLSPKIISVACVAVIIILILGKMQLFKYYPSLRCGNKSYVLAPDTLTNLNWEINRLQQKVDSAERKKRFLIDGVDGYGGFTSVFFGFMKPYYIEEENDAKSNVELLKLTGIGLKIQEVEGPKYLAFYTKNEKSYITKTKLADGAHGKTVFYVDKEVDYKYSSEDNSILLPVESGFWNTVLMVVNFALIIVVLATFLFAITTFFKFLIATSNNQLFDEGNIERLRDLSICFLLLGIYNYPINLIIYGIFSFSHSTDGVTLTRSFWDFDCYLIIFSAFSFLIYTAFKKAMILQQEQEFTV